MVEAEQGSLHARVLQCPKSFRASVKFTAVVITVTVITHWKIKSAVNSHLQFHFLKRARFAFFYCGSSSNMPYTSFSVVGDGDLDLHPRLDADGCDLLDDLGRRVQVDDALVDAHLEVVPGL